MIDIDVGNWIYTFIELSLCELLFQEKKKCQIVFRISSFCCRIQECLCYL